MTTRKLQLKDIAEVEVLRALHDARGSKPYRKPLDILVERAGVPEKLAFRKLEQASAKLLADYGVSPAGSWLTREGEERLRELAPDALTNPMWLK